VSYRSSHPHLHALGSYISRTIWPRVPQGSRYNPRADDLEVRTTSQAFGTEPNLIYRELVYTSLRPPQVGTVREVDAIVERYNYDFRRLYISRPRVRLDGVYIAICHYVYAIYLVSGAFILMTFRRAGLSENHWVNVSSLFERSLKPVLDVLIDQPPDHLPPLLVRATVSSLCLLTTAPDGFCLTDKFFRCSSTRSNLLNKSFPYSNQVCE